MIIAVTGHRPDKLGGYGEEAWGLLCGFAALTVKELRPEKVITGMAQGWDMAIASACVALNIPFVAAIPFRGQERVWPHDKRRLYRLLCTQASEFHVVSGGDYAAWKMLVRNKWMVDRCEEVVALYDGASSGGTFKCVEYALKKKVPIVNVWEKWTDHVATEATYRGRD